MIFVDEFVGVFEEYKFVFFLLNDVKTLSQETGGLGFLLLFYNLL